MRQHQSRQHPGIDDLAACLGVDFQDVPRSDAGSGAGVNQQVDPLERLQGALDDLLTAGVVCQVCPAETYLDLAILLPGRRENLLDYGLAVVTLAEVLNKQRPAATGKLDCRRLTQPRCPAGHQCYMFNRIVHDPLPGLSCDCIDTTRSYCRMKVRRAAAT